MVASYPSPVDKLLTYGEIDILEVSNVLQEDREHLHSKKRGINYVEELGFTLEHVPDLLRMVVDEELNFGDGENLEYWAPIHALRVIGELRAEDAIQPLIDFFQTVDQENDSIMMALPDAIATIGEKAISPLEACITNFSQESNQDNGCEDAVIALGSIATKYPELSDRCVKILTQQLECFADNKTEINGLLIEELIELNVVESAPIIEKVFAAKRVSLCLVRNWEEAQIELGLKEQPPAKYVNYSFDEEFKYSRNQPQSTAQGFASSNPQQKKKNQKKAKK
ncbi:hypothetical protein [Brunnivagina elsteri]|uniref:PBS lyase n=1 Tax=Brunnivagina elsteri CCALA 953 TaxID=987040 RepID=A0A2A2TH80_9CYAN|nr:hypothetical protein [Calothrix elsteri]PAX53036.1 hypothetical protein CK510_16100 [Calothrix elsteri CCALA 953]